VRLHLQGSVVCSRVSSTHPCCSEPQLLLENGRGARVPHHVIHSTPPGAWQCLGHLLLTHAMAPLPLRQVHGSAWATCCSSMPCPLCRAGHGAEVPHLPALHWVDGGRVCHSCASADPGAHPFQCTLRHGEHVAVQQVPCGALKCSELTYQDRTRMLYILIMKMLYPQL